MNRNDEQIGIGVFFFSVKKKKKGTDLVIEEALSVENHFSY